MTALRGALPGAALARPGLREGRDLRRNAQFVGAPEPELREPVREGGGSIDLSSRDQARLLFRADRDMAADAAIPEEGHSAHDTEHLGVCKENTWDGLDVCPWCGYCGHTDGTQMAHEKHTKHRTRPERIPVTLTAQEKAEIENEAAAEKLSAAAWLRSLAFKVIRERRRSRS